MADDKILRGKALRQMIISNVDGLHTYSIDIKDTPENFSRFKIRCRPLERWEKEFDKHHSNIITLTASLDNAEDLLQTEQEVYSDFILKVSDIQAIYYEIFELPEENHSNTSISNSETKSVQNVSLPKINLPTFGGDIKQFPTFFEMFDALVNRNGSLSDIQKFHYLLSILKGEPLLLVKCTPLLGENYQRALNALTERYNNRRLLATSYWRQIESFPQLKTDNVQALRNILDIFTQNLSGLEALGFHVKNWDFLLMNMLLDRLDPNTLRSFELSFASTEVPTYSCLREFLLKHCTSLESIALNSKNTKGSNSGAICKEFRNVSKVKQSLFASMCDSVMETGDQSVISPLSNDISEHKINLSSHIDNNLSSPNKSLQVSEISESRRREICIVCQKNHIVFQCPSFLSRTPTERFRIVKAQKACVNCLAKSHHNNNCLSTKRCRQCQKKHHTLLHFGTAEKIDSTKNDATSETFTGLATHSHNVLLATVLLNIWDAFGNPHQVRGIIDSGSQATFLRRDLANKLNLKKYHVTVSVQGLDKMRTPASSGVSCQISPSQQNVEEPNLLNVDAILVDNICENMPSSSFVPKPWRHLSNLYLSDPNYYESSRIDILLGGDLFPHILRDGLIISEPGAPIAFNTLFGWAVMGKIKLSGSTTVNAFLSALTPSSEETVSLTETMRRFWEVEEVPAVKIISPDDTFCEEYFCRTTQRDSVGSFVVALPFKVSTSDFGMSRSMAERRLYSLERRFSKNASLYASYSKCIQEYIDQNHIEPLDETSLEVSSPNVFYLPHSCVYKPESVSTPVRIVFDGSSKIAGKLSLNEALLTGPKLQPDIVEILLKFRMHKFVFTCDIRQMYRMIQVTEEHRNFLRLLWRFSPEQSIAEFRLKTLPFGLVCSPFLAIRTLKLLSEHYQHEWPLAAEVLTHDTYIDDIVTGHDSLDVACVIKDQLIRLLGKANFELRKWSSNDATLLLDLPESHVLDGSSFLDFGESKISNVLGLRWDPRSDCFSYSFTASNTVCSKRSILSEVARIYDPLGVLAPFLISFKILVQHLWSLGLGWDDYCPEDISTKVAKLKEEMGLISKLQFPRYLEVANSKGCQLIGFCDASIRAYCAVVYLRVATVEQRIHVGFVCAKTKVAPLKTVSLPRLELCGAVLLAKLLKYVYSIISRKVNIDQVYAWTDSSIVLSWLSASPHRWKTFVSNRVAYIQERVDYNLWHHIASSLNPADAGSRGLYPSELLKCDIWFNGPDFLKSPIESWKLSNFEVEEDKSELERKAVVLNAFVSDDRCNAWIDDLLTKFSSLRKILNIVSFVVCFIHNLQEPHNRWTSPFSAVVLRKSLLILARRVQSIYLSKEISLVVSKRSVPKKFRKLNMFVDKYGLLRVGGRLVYAELHYDKRFPILLPSVGSFTSLLISYVHELYLHAGVHHTFYLVSQMFWILSAKKVIRRLIFQCRNCWKTNPPTYQQPMGNLPTYRISQVKPFSVVGVDLGGPFDIIMNKVRGAKTLKAYICLFVCCATKALHIELISDLSKEAFLAGFRRFISRRGRCSKIFSDCGTNFVASAKYFKSLMHRIQEKEGIEWNFNPPSAPHMGGLWESGIKSVKNHLVRVIGQQILSYEELNTVLVQIEAVLNSRPLCPISTDPNDLRALTPGHFLTLEPLLAVPDNEVVETAPLNRLTRWQLLQRLHLDFWSRWKREYLQTLHQRAKWHTPAAQVEVGTMVLLRDEQAKPLNWRLGRIVELHTGGDGVTRVVTVKTARGLYKRPLIKLCPLPHN